MGSDGMDTCVARVGVKGLYPHVLASILIDTECLVSSERDLDIDTSATDNHNRLTTEFTAS